jgi:hypothetical protein
MTALELSDLGFGHAAGASQVGHRPPLSGPRFLDDIAEFVF